MKLSISHKSIKVEGENRIDVNTDYIIINPEIDHTVKKGIFLTGVEGTLTEIIDQILEVDHETITDKMIGETITGKMIGEIVTDKIIEEITIEITIGTIIDKIIIEVKGIEIGVQVEVGMVTEVITEIIQGKEVEILVVIGIGKDSHDHDLE